MNKYIALLRGINVGGKNKASMIDLKNAFLNNGFKYVITYINSGNIIFSTDDENELELKIKCELIIKNEFNLDIVVLILSTKDLIDYLDNAPIWWGKDKESKHNAVFVIPPTTAQEMVKTIGLINSSDEQVKAYGQIIFWSAPIKTFTKTRLSKFVSANPCNNITIRNSNTTKKLLKLID